MHGTMRTIEHRLATISLVAQDGPRYQVNHVWGEGPHSNNRGGAILPDMLRWIWKDYPE